MKALIKGISLLLLLLSLAGCSRKKNNFLSRNWHAITAEYNTLYNGNLALEQGREELNANYFDNYWELLPVERMQVVEPSLGLEETRNANFEVAEEKAVKAIQRHSMLIDGRERNPQIDEAYLLLGQARYFDQRFVPALEAFNFILHKYPLSNTIDQARIWREKTNIRLEFEEVAKENLKEILEQESLEEQARADASAMLAQAYINLNHKDSAVAPIKRAAELTENKEEKGRYHFITGQLYTQLGKRDSANLAFDRVIAMNRRTPREYLINAQLAKIRNSGLGPENEKEIQQLLSELEEDRENRGFLDKIYFQLAEFHLQRDSIDLAIAYYNKSLRTPTDDAYLESLSYETLGNLYFDAADFAAAGAYYDSTLLRLPEGTRDFRRIRKKRENLEEVIYYEAVARANDSILYLASLTEAEQLEYFTRYTEELQKAAEALAVNENETLAEARPFGDAGLVPPGLPTPGNTFYFYNPATVAYGREEFRRIWGGRELTDNWRTGGGNLPQPENENLPSDEELALERDPRFDPATYMDGIPADRTVLDSLASERNFAYYQLGLIYRNKFGEYELAAEKLEELLDSNPEERLILPAKYNLFRSYEEMGASAKAASLKNDILYEYPESRYASILRDPEGRVEIENDPETRYRELYALFENQEYEEVIARTTALAEQLMGDSIVPKLELLQAMATGRLMGFEAYKKALNELALAYPQSEEGKRAQRLYEEALPGIADDGFVERDAGDSFKLIFPFEKKDSVQVVSFREELLGAIGESGFSGLEVSLDVYNPRQVFVVVHGFGSPGSAEYFNDLLTNRKEAPIQEKSFYISTANYRVLQIHKNMETYLSNKPPN